MAEQSAQRARRGVTVTVFFGPDPADGAGLERAQHTPTPRAGHVPGQQDLLGPLGARHDHQQRTSEVHPSSIAYHTRRREGPAGVAASQLSPCAVTKLPTSSTTGDRPTIPVRTDRPTWTPRRVGAVVTPTIHRRAHPVSATPVTHNPRVHGHPRWGPTPCGAW